MFYDIYYEVFEMEFIETFNYNDLFFYCRGCGEEFSKAA